MCVQRKDMILTVPNVLTLSRMLMSPILGYLIVANSYAMACILFAVAGATDLVSFTIITRCNAQPVSNPPAYPRHCLLIILNLLLNFVPSVL